MLRFLTLILICNCVAIVSPGFAWQSPEIVEAQGELCNLVFVAPTPTPGICCWASGEPVGTDFFASEVDGDGNMDCPYPWMVHCDRDSMIFEGTWPLMDFPYLVSVEYQATLSCTVVISEATQLFASRVVMASGLFNDEHSIFLEYPNGSSVELLGAGSESVQNRLILPPGNYSIRMHVYCSQYRYTHGVVTPYSGRVSLAWEEPGTVSVESTQWCNLKALFRN